MPAVVVITTCPHKRGAKICRLEADHPGCHRPQGGGRPWTDTCTAPAWGSPEWRSSRAWHGVRVAARPYNRP